MTTRRRYKSPGELTPNEHLAAIQAERQGEAVHFETTAYKTARVQALGDAGLHEEAAELARSYVAADGGEPDHDQMSIQDHLKEAQRP
jgi:hypothetical protein